MNWYFAVEGHSHGPITEQKLSEMARTGEVGTDTLIWHPGLEEWEPVWKLKPEIVGHLNKKAMAQQAKGTTDRIPIMEMAESKSEPTVANEGIFKRFMSKLRGK